MTYNLVLIGGSGAAFGTEMFLQLKYGQRPGARGELPWPDDLWPSAVWYIDNDLGTGAERSSSERVPTHSLLPLLERLSKESPSGRAVQTRRPTEAGSGEVLAQHVLDTKCPEGSDWFKTTLTTNARRSTIDKGFQGRPNVATTVMCARGDVQELYRTVSAGADTCVLAGSIMGGTGAGVLPTLAREFRSPAVDDEKDLYVVALLPWFGTDEGQEKGNTPDAAKGDALLPTWDELRVNARGGVRSLRDFAKRIVEDDFKHPTGTRKTFVYLVGPDLEVARKSPPPPTREHVRLSGTVSPYLADAAVGLLEELGPVDSRGNEGMLERSGLVTLTALRSATLSTQAQSAYSLGVALALERIAEWPLEEMGGLVPRSYMHLPRPIRTILLASRLKRDGGDELIRKFREGIKTRASQLREAAGARARVVTPASPCTDTQNIKGILDAFPRRYESALKLCVDAETPDVDRMVELISFHLGVHLPDLWSLKDTASVSAAPLFPVAPNSADAFFREGPWRHFLDRRRKGMLGEHPALGALEASFGKVDGVHSRGYASVRSLQQAVEASPAHVAAARDRLQLARAQGRLGERHPTAGELALLERSREYEDKDTSSLRVLYRGTGARSVAIGVAEGDQVHPHADLVDSDGSDRWSSGGWLSPNPKSELQIAWDSLNSGSMKPAGGLEAFQTLAGEPFNEHVLKPFLDKGLSAFSTALTKMPSAGREFDLEVEFEGKRVPFPSLPGVILERRTPADDRLALFVWKGASGVTWTTAPGGGGTLTMSGNLRGHGVTFKIAMTRDLLPVVELDDATVFLSKVLVFDGRDRGKPRWPHVPVRWEYLHLVEKSDITPSLSNPYQARWSVTFRSGLQREWGDEKVAVAVARSQQVGTGGLYPPLPIAVWPGDSLSRDLRPGWKFFSFLVGDDDAPVVEEVAKAQDAVIKMRIEGRTCEAEVSLLVASRGGAHRVKQFKEPWIKPIRSLVTEDVPRYLHIGLKNAGDIGGAAAVFTVFSPDEWTTAEGVADNILSIGLDHGTTNTCVAFPTPQGVAAALDFGGQATCPALVLVPNLDDARGVSTNAPWLPNVPSTLADLEGTSHALLPSMLLYYPPGSSLFENTRLVPPAVNTTEVKGWKCESNLKWNQESRVHRRHFLEMALLWTVASLGRRKVEVHPSYPLAFQPHELNAYRDDLSEAVKVVQGHTGATVSVGLFRDEASVLSIGHRKGLHRNHEATLVFCVSIDIGGGTIDTVINMMKADSGGGLWHFNNAGLGSARFGAGYLASALKQACNAPDPNTVEFRIRRGDFRPFADSSVNGPAAEAAGMEVISRYWEGAGAQENLRVHAALLKKSRRDYLQYVLEYVARLVAGLLRDDLSLAFRLQHAPSSNVSFVEEAALVRGRSDWTPQIHYMMSGSGWKWVPEHDLCVRNGAGWGDAGSWVQALHHRVEALLGRSAVLGGARMEGKDCVARFLIESTAKEHKTEEAGRAKGTCVSNGMGVYTKPERKSWWYRQVGSGSLVAWMAQPGNAAPSGVTIDDIKRSWVAAHAPSDSGRVDDVDAPVWPDVPRTKPQQEDIKKMQARQQAESAGLTYRVISTQQAWLETSIVNPDSRMFDPQAD